MLLTKYCVQLKGILAKSLKQAQVMHYEITIETCPAFLLNVLFFLKNSTYSRFCILSDLVVSDKPSLKNRFTLVYNLLSLKYGSRLFLGLRIPEFCAVPSVTGTYSAAN